MFAGRFASSRSHLEEALALYDPISHRALVHQAGFHPHVLSQAYLGNALFCLGFPDQALARSNASVAGARRLPRPPSWLRAWHSAPYRFRSSEITQSWASGYHLVAMTTEQGSRSGVLLEGSIAGG